MTKQTASIRSQADLIAHLAQGYAVKYPVLLAQAKQLGRQVAGFDNAAWEAARFDPEDRIWGIGLAATHDHASQPQRWKGLNLLGFALMEVREKLR